MSNSRELLQKTWAEKDRLDMSQPYRPGLNLRVDAARLWLTSGSQLLDLGCGAGVLGEAVGNDFATVHGVDLADRAVALATARGVVARVWDLNETPYPYADETFAAVVSLSVIQYVFNPVAFLRETARIVEPGGQVLIGFPNMRALWRVWRLAVLGRFPGVSRDPGYDGGTIRYFCRRNVDALLRGVGLESRRATGVFVKPGWLEAGGRVPGVREFLSAEILIEAEKPTG